MKVGEKERLEALTLSALKDRKSFTSAEYIEAYDIIYNYCTKVTPVFETRGKHVYEVLKQSLSAYTEQLRFKCTLVSFHTQVAEFKQSLALVSALYSYIERYFVKINLEKRDGNVQDTRTLALAIFYRKYAKDVLLQIKGLMIDEIQVARSSRSFNFSQLAEVVSFVRQMLYYNDEEDEYNGFVSKYLGLFYDSVDFSGDIEKVLRKVYLEIYIASRIFENDNKRLYKSIVGNLKARFGDVLGFITKRIKSFERFKLYTKIVYFMDEESIRRLIDEYKKIMAAKILESEGFEGLKGTYLRICEQIEDNFSAEENLLSDVNAQVRQFFDTFGDVEALGASIVESIEQAAARREGLKQELEALVVFITLLPNKESVVERITSAMQRRLLNGRTSLEWEGKLVELLERHLSAPQVTRASISYNNHMDIVKGSFSLSSQPFKFYTELKLLTKGFYSAGKSTQELPYPLNDIQKIIVNPYRIRYPKCEIGFSHQLSSMIFQIGLYNFRLSIEKFLVLDFLSTARAHEDLPDGSEESIEFLLSNGFVVRSNGTLSINRSFSEREYAFLKSKYPDRVFRLDGQYNMILEEEKVLSSQILEGVVLQETILQGSAVEEVVDLFDFAYDVPKAPLRDKAGSLDSSRVVIEARIMRLLKKRKRIEISEVVCEINKEFSKDEECIRTIINRLVEKEYAVIDGDSMAYLI
jgi:hypothetical protein